MIVVVASTPDTDWRSPIQAKDDVRPRSRFPISLVYAVFFSESGLCRFREDQPEVEPQLVPVSVVGEHHLCERGPLN